VGNRPVHRKNDVTGATPLPATWRVTDGVISQSALYGLPVAPSSVTGLEWTPLGFALSKELLLTVRFKYMKAFDDCNDNLSRHPLQAGGPGAATCLPRST
jgi:hypothetical protein